MNTKKSREYDLFQLAFWLSAGLPINVQCLKTLTFKECLDDVNNFSKTFRVSYVVIDHWIIINNPFLYGEFVSKFLNQVFEVLAASDKLEYYVLSNFLISSQIKCNYLFCDTLSLEIYCQGKFLFDYEKLKVIEIPFLTVLKS